MEKYRKFDDARVGVNPFVPTKPKEIGAVMSILLSMFSLVFLVFKLPFVLLVLLLLQLFHLLKYILVVPALVRLSERCTDLVFVKVLMQSWALMRVTEVFHKEDADFDFVKAKQNRLFVDSGKHIHANEPTILLANDTGILSFLWLVNQFSPLVVTMDFDNQTGQAGLRPLGRLEILQRAIGIRFPSRVDGAVLFKSFKELRSSRYVQNRPIVFFPECTKSNGKGVLALPKEAVALIQAAIQADGFKAHALRFDFGSSSASMSPYNSTDVTGLKHAITMLFQVNNRMQIQYLFNLQLPQHCGKIKDAELSKTLQEAFMSRGHEYCLDKDWHDHEEFLKYWALNQ